MNDKKIEDYLHLYLRCPIMYKDKNRGEVFTELSPHALEFPERWPEFKLILRPVSDMSQEEGEHLAWLLMDSERHLEADSRVSKEEIQTHIHKNDGGNLMDIDLSIVVDVSCRCFEGQIAVYPNGDIKMWDEDEKEEPVENISEIVRWMLKCQFDLFGLIESALAIDKTKQSHEIKIK